ncbi:MAG TPA: hypothetical protein PL100_06445 [Bacillota bacterium]|jgi:tight adherence protein B|nr:hypothetical protein [Bacillota bacterium]HQC49143.1 hypothetical protein [Bacillota bacterium]
MFKKKKKAPPEPEFFLSATNMPTRNFRVYYMKRWEKFGYALLAFVAGAAVGYLFYGGLGKDEFGQPTTITYILNILIPTIAGIIAARLFIPARTKAIIGKRKRQLARQFRDMLDGLTTSLSAGKNVTDAFYAVYEDLKVQYDSDAFILRELELILSGIQNNFPVEQLLEDFGKRSDIDDISSFAGVFSISYRKGGNIKDVIRNTHAILSDKMAIEEDIETMLTANKTEQNIMAVMPIAIVALIKGMSPDFAKNFASPAGILASTVAIIIFIIAYYVGKSVLNIKM